MVKKRREKWSIAEKKIYAFGMSLDSIDIKYVIQIRLDRLLPE